MGQLLDFVCPCFRKYVIVTCKFVSFLCSLDNFLLKNIIVFILGVHNLKWYPFDKRAIFNLFSHFYSHQGKFFWHMSYFNRNTFVAHPVNFVLPYKFCKKCKFIIYGFSLVCFLVQTLICVIFEIEQSVKSKRWAKFKWV